MRTCSKDQMKILDAWRVWVMYVLVIEGVMSNSLRIERAAPFWHQKERETWQFPEACSNWKNICHAFRWAASIWSISSQRKTNTKEWSKSGLEENERVRGPDSITKDLLDRINRQERSKDWREKLHVSIAVRVNLPHACQIIKTSQRKVRAIGACLLELMGFQWGVGSEGNDVPHQRPN